MNKKTIFLCFIAIISFIIIGFSIYERTIAAEIEEESDYYVVTFPTGSYFSVILQQPIDTGIIKEDDLIETIVPTNLYIETLLVIPQGTRIIGKVAYLEKAHQGRNALINIRFIALTAPNNSWEIPIDASILDKNSDGSIGGQLTNRTKVKLIAHNVEQIGTYDQAIPTGPREMGKEIYIPPGERWVIQLNQPARVIISK